MEVDAIKYLVDRVPVGTRAKGPTRGLTHVRCDSPEATPSPHPKEAGCWVGVFGGEVTLECFVNMVPSCHRV